MSAPLRYARILNGLSSLISRRSAISRRIRAMAALSIAVRMRFMPHPQTFRRRRCHARRETLAVFPLFGDLAADLVPVMPLERCAHRDCRIANTLEAVEDVAIAVDVTLGD